MHRPRLVPYHLNCLFPPQHCLGASDLPVRCVSPEGRKMDGWVNTRVFGQKTVSTGEVSLFSLEPPWNYANVLTRWHTLWYVVEDVLLLVNDQARHNALDAAISLQDSMA